MDIFHYSIIFIAGVVAGLMNAVAGGGTIVTFPALIFMGIPSIAANATSTVALIPSALGYTFGYRKNIPAVWPWIKKFALVSLLGGLLGGLLLVRTPTKVFDWLVPFLILTATLLFTAHSFFSRLSKYEASHYQGADRAKWVVGAIIFQFVVSIYGGYFGAGLGILMLATLGMLGVGNIHEMNTIKGILGFLINITAAIYFATIGLVHWREAAVMTCGSMLGGYSGAHFAQRIPQKAVRHLITGIGLVLTIYTFVKQIKR